MKKSVKTAITYLLSASVISLLFLILFLVRSGQKEYELYVQRGESPPLLQLDLNAMERITDETMQEYFHTDFRWSALKKHELYADSDHRQVLFQAWFSEHAPSSELWAAKNYAYQLFFIGKHAKYKPLPYDSWRIGMLDYNNTRMNLLVTQIYIEDQLYLQEEYQNNTVVYHEYIQHAVADQEINSQAAQAVNTELKRLLPGNASVRIVKAITRDAAAVQLFTEEQVNPDKLPDLQEALSTLEEEYTRVVLQLYLKEAAADPYYCIYSYEGDWRSGHWTEDVAPSSTAGT